MVVLLLLWNAPDDDDGRPTSGSAEMEEVAWGGDVIAGVADEPRTGCGGRGPMEPDALLSLDTGLEDGRRTGRGVF